MPLQERRVKLKTKVKQHSTNAPLKMKGEKKTAYARRLKRWLKNKDTEVLQNEKNI